MKTTLLILVLIITLLTPSMVTCQITMGVQVGHSDKPMIGFTMTATPDKVGVYLAGRFEGTDASGQAGITFSLSTPVMLYAAGSGTLYDEAENRVGYGCELGALLGWKSVYLQLGIGTNEFRTVNTLVGVGVKIK